MEHATTDITLEMRESLRAGELASRHRGAALTVSGPRFPA